MPVTTRIMTELNGSSRKPQSMVKVEMAPVAVWNGRPAIMAVIVAMILTVAVIVRVIVIVRVRMAEHVFVPVIVAVMMRAVIVIVTVLVNRLAAGGPPALT